MVTVPAPGVRPRFAPAEELKADSASRHFCFLPLGLARQAPCCTDHRDEGQECSLSWSRPLSWASRQPRGRGTVSVGFYKRPHRRGAGTSDMGVGRVGGGYQSSAAVAGGTGR
jgi:hypothetical protein